MILCLSGRQTETNPQKTDKKKPRHLKRSWLGGIVFQLVIYLYPIYVRDMDIDSKSEFDYYTRKIAAGARAFL